MSIRALVCYSGRKEGSQCDLLSTLFQFTPLFIQVWQRRICLAQHVIVRDSLTFKYSRGTSLQNQKSGPVIPDPPSTSGLRYRVHWNHQTNTEWETWLHLGVALADVEKVEGEDVVFGSHHESSFLLVQQESVVSWTVGQTFKRHQVVGFQHFCRGTEKVKWSGPYYNTGKISITASGKWWFYICNTNLENQDSFSIFKRHVGPQIHLSICTAESLFVHVSCKCFLSIIYSYAFLLTGLKWVQLVADSRRGAAAKPNCSGQVMPAPRASESDLGHSSQAHICTSTVENEMNMKSNYGVQTLFLL